MGQIAVILLSHSPSDLTTCKVNAGLQEDRLPGEKPEVQRKYIRMTGLGCGVKTLPRGFTHKIKRECSLPTPNPELSC